MSRGGGPKAPPRTPIPNSSSPAGPTVGASSFTDSGVAQSLQHNIADTAQTSATSTRAVAEPACTEKYYDKFDGSNVLERLYGRKDETEAVEYRGEMFAPISNKSKDALLKKINAIATGGK